MYCPLKFNSKTLDADGNIKNEACHCEGTDCAWWNERFRMCCQAVGDYLEGIEDYKLEKDQYGD